jgi:pimeloyl-ACP methyl ester carboxylesterase
MLRPKRKIIISVHGIRTTGAWQKQIASVVSENGWIYYPMDYGYFTILHFANPLTRKARIKWFCHEFDQIKERFPGITPSVIAHSNGTYIVANALKTYEHIRVDKVILCGSIARRDFDWEPIFRRRQATMVRNEIGTKDIWSKWVRWLAWSDTGPSGQKGFSRKHDRLVQKEFADFDHGSFQAYGHYRTFWLPFLEDPIPYLGEKEPPWYSEEPVSPYDAARWSAMTYYYQYVTRVHQAIANGQAFENVGGPALPAKCLWVIVPKTPGRAAKDALIPFFQKHKLKTGCMNDRRTFYFNSGETLYDVPTTLNTLGFLDNRKDEELDDAVNEFINLLNRLIHGARSHCSDTVTVKRMDEIPESLS